MTRTQSCCAFFRFASPPSMCRLTQTRRERGSDGDDYLYEKLIPPALVVFSGLVCKHVNLKQFFRTYKWGSLGTRSHLVQVNRAVRVCLTCFHCVAFCIDCKSSHIYLAYTEIATSFDQLMNLLVSLMFDKSFR